MEPCISADGIDPGGVNASNAASNLDLQAPGDILTLSAGGPGIVQRRANEATMFTNGTIPASCY
jgi:hypothetical protein